MGHLNRVKMYNRDLLKDDEDKHLQCYFEERAQIKFTVNSSSYLCTKSHILPNSFSLAIPWGSSGMWGCQGRRGERKPWRTRVERETKADVAAERDEIVKRNAQSSERGFERLAGRGRSASWNNVERTLKSSARNPGRHPPPHFISAPSAFGGKKIPRDIFSSCLSFNPALTMLIL